MSSCTNTWVQRKAGRHNNTTVSNHPCYYPPNAEPPPTSNGNSQDEYRAYNGELEEWLFCGNQPMDFDSMSSHESIDGESLDTYDWMELVARGAVTDREMEESFLPMTIDLSEYHGSDLHSNKPAVSSEEQSEMTFDDSSDTSGKEDADETNWESSSVSTSEFDQDDYQLAIG